MHCNQSTVSVLILLEARGNQNKLFRVFAPTYHIVSELIIKKMCGHMRWKKVEENPPVTALQCFHLQFFIPRLELPEKIQSKQPTRSEYFINQSQSSITDLAIHSTCRPWRATARTKTLATMTLMMWRGTMETALWSQHSNTGA